MRTREGKDWLDAWSWLQDRKDAPAVIVAHCKDMKNKVLRQVSLPKARLPAFADIGKIKAKLERDLEAICKRIVKKRDLDSNGVGRCVTCKKPSNRLQWGHFIEQHKSAWLRFDPRNTAMQCEDCNGFGHGMTYEFGQAIDTRDGAGAAEALKQERSRKEYWVPSTANLEEKLKELLAMEAAA